MVGFGLLLLGVVTGGTLREQAAPHVGHAGSAAVGAGAVPTAVVPDGQPHRYAFPVMGPVTYTLSHHEYPATDIMAACGATVRAVTDGSVLEVNRTDRYDASADDGATRGGLYVSILGDDGVRYYGSHFGSIAPTVTVGARLGAGDVLGTVGESGHASTCHLHFGISPPCARAGDWWIRRGVIWPGAYLDSWRAGSGASPAGEARAWQRAHGCPKAP